MKAGYPIRAPAVGSHSPEELVDSRNPGWDEVGDDERGREEEQAEDEVPDEAVALAASDRAGQNAMTIQMIANKIHHKTDTTVSPPRSVRNARVLPDSSTGTGCSLDSDHRCTSRFPGKEVGR